MKTKLPPLLLFATVLGTAAPANAFWLPIDTIPKPNMALGVHHGVTMGMDEFCGGCHSTGDWRTSPDARLDRTQQALIPTMEMFKDYFIWGGYTYHGCDRATVSWRQIPNPANPAASYTATYNRMDTLSAVGCGEKNWPSGAFSSSYCLMPAPGCALDPFEVPVLLANIEYNNGLAGMAIPTSPTAAAQAGAVACDQGPSPFFDLGASLAAKFSTFNWPRFSVGNAAPPPGQVLTEWCQPLELLLTNVRNEINNCQTNPASIWDMTFLDAALTTWCDHNAVAANVCNVQHSSSSPGLKDTCACVSEHPDCADSIATSECGVLGVVDSAPWGRPGMQQQVAVCEAYSTAAANRFGTYYNGQLDNIIQPPPNGCRENVNIILTDGLHGDLWTVNQEAQNALTAGYYWSSAGLSNMFVFKVSNVFNPCSESWCGPRFMADRMHWYLSNYTDPTAYNAFSQSQLQESFATVISRIYKGVYSAAGLGTTASGNRVAIHSMTVPGYNVAPVPVTDTYHAFVTKVSVHEVDAAGNIVAAPRYETDWSSRTGVTGCYKGVKVPGAGPDLNLFGPTGVLRNGQVRQRVIPSGMIDRNGDRVLDGADNLPAAAGGSVTIGRNSGFASSKPVFVGGPIDVPVSGYEGEFKTFVSTYRARPQVMYFTDGAYLVGIHAGDYTGPGTYGYEAISYAYDDSSPNNGREVLRYFPDSWVKILPPVAPALGVKYDYRVNDVIPQPMITGELVSRDLRIKLGAINPTQYRTMLIGNQGKNGPGYFAVDVTDPCGPAPWYREFRLPNNDEYASATPAIYNWPMATDPKFRPVLITTSGLDSPRNNLYAFDIGQGAAPTSVLSAVALPAAAGASYATAPACVDARGEGFITHCYVLRSDGFVARIRINTLAGNGVFAAYAPATDNATPVDSFGAQLSMGAGLEYSTPPVAYFDSKGRVNLTFASGSHRNLTATPPQNYIFRSIDLGTKTAAGPSARLRLDNVCQPNAGNTLGRIALGSGERVISPLTVVDGLVAVTTYESQTNGCVSGNGQLYVMNAENCTEGNLANGVAPRPAAVPLQPGIPTQPAYHRQSGTFLVGGSAKVQGGQNEAADARRPRVSRLNHRKLYFRGGTFD